MEANLSITPINEAEAIIARFFDPLRKQVEAWHREVVPHRQENSIEASWHALVDSVQYKLSKKQ